MLLAAIPSGIEVATSCPHWPDEQYVDPLIPVLLFIPNHCAALLSYLRFFSFRVGTCVVACCCRVLVFVLSRFVDVYLCCRVLLTRICLCRLQTCILLSRMLTCVLCSTSSPVLDCHLVLLINLHVCICMYVIDITMIAQKLTLRISPPKLPCPGTAPVAAINVKFSGNMPRFVLGKVRKFQDPSSNRLGDI